MSMDVLGAMVIVGLAAVFVGVALSLGRRTIGEEGEKPSAGHESLKSPQ